MKIKPCLNFYYSPIYDRQIHECKGKRWKDVSKKAARYISNLKKDWNKIERKAFNAISSVSGLDWKKSCIDCYIVQIGKPFSMPLTISMKATPKEHIETLIHELIHNILVQNLNKVRIKSYRKYGKLNERTRIHVLVHAILKKVLLELYGEKQTKKFIKKYDKWPDYKKAWEIVEQEGSEKIIRENIKN